MDNVNVYTYSGIKGIKETSGAYGYVLEMETEKGPATLSNIKTITEVTGKQSELRALIEALKRLKKPCALSIYADSQFLTSGFEYNWIENWQKNDWLNAKGKPVAYRSEWEELANLLNAHLFQFLVGQRHRYYEWLVREVKAKEGLEDERHK